MRRFWTGMMLCLALVSRSGAEDGESGSRFSDQVHVPANVGFSATVSEDGQVATLLFDDMYVQNEATRQGARGTHGQTVVETKVVTFNLPYSTDQRSVRMAMDIRGFTDAMNGACVRLVACAGEVTQVIDLTPEPEGTVVDLKGDTKCEFQEEYPQRKFGDFFEHVEFTVQMHAKQPVLQLTLFLAAEHDIDIPDQGAALLVVDSVDLSIMGLGEAKYEQ